MRSCSMLNRLQCRFAVSCAVAALLAACSTPNAGDAARDSGVEGGTDVGNDAPCVPACRTGFVCVAGACVSACNPPCPAGQVCTPDLQCIVPADGGPDGGMDASDVAADAPTDASTDGPMDAATTETTLTDAAPTDSHLLPLDGGAVVSMSIGPAGGTISSPMGVQLIVPAGALASPTTVTIQDVAFPSDAILPAGATQAGPAVDLGPDGLAFANGPVTLVLPYDPSADPDDVFPAVRGPDGRFYEAGRREAEGPTFVVDPVAHVIRVDTDHFCVWATVKITGWRARVNAVPVTMLPPTPEGLAIGVHQMFHTVVVPESVGWYGTRTHAQVTNIILHSTGDRGDCAGWNGAMSSLCVSGVGHEGCCFTGTCESDTGLVRFALLANADREYIDLSSCSATSCNCAAANGFFAHFYVFHDGRIYQILPTEGMDSVAPQVYGSTANLQSVGIEVVHGGGDGLGVEEAGWPGAQIAAVTRLVDYLARYYNIPRRAPVATITDGVGFLNPPFILAHREVDTRTTGRHNDPPTSFPWEAVLGATQSGFSGLIDASGSSANGSGIAGNGGAVTFAQLTTAPPAVAAQCQVRRVTSSPVPAATGDLTLDGVIDFMADTTISVPGSIYVTPSSVIQTHGHRLILQAGGVIVIDGAIASGGADGTAGSPNGVPGGAISINTYSNAPIILPSILSRGGNNMDDTTDLAGNGGTVTITGGPNPDGVPATVWLRGEDVPDFLARPSFGGTSFTFVAPTGVGSLRGAVTHGGAGGSGTVPPILGGVGGAGGDVVIDVGSTGTIVGQGYTILTGADTGDPSTALFRTYRISNARLGVVMFPEGSTGGRGGVTFGTARPGNGGAGGGAGNITINGTILQRDTAHDRSIPISRFDGSTAATGPLMNAHATMFRTSTGLPLLTVSAAGGSGGCSGGHSASAPDGYSGPFGPPGTIMINGSPIVVMP